MPCKMTVEKVSSSDSVVAHNDNGVKSGDSHDLVQQDKENVNIENEDDEVLADDREEGEIVDEFEDIISSDEELTMMKRIEELEATNAELEKIANISEVYGYDLGYDRYQKPDVINYGDKVDYDITDDYHHSSLYIPSTTKRLLTKSSLLPSTKIKSNPIGTVNADRDLKHRHHHHHHHNHHHHHRRNQYSNNSFRDQEIYDNYEEERDFISPSPEVLIKQRKRKRKHHKTSTRCSKKSKSNEKQRKKKSRHTSPMLFTDSNSDENDDDDDDDDVENAACILNRDELRMALIRDVTTTKTLRKCLPKGNLKITIDKNENSNGDYGNRDLKVIRTIDLVSDTENNVDRKEDDKDNQKLNIVEEISLDDNSGDDDDDDDDGNDSASLEEQELRLIALKSAIVKNHLARKKRRESDDKRPYSPSDNYTEMYNLCVDGGEGSGQTSKDLSSLPSPNLFDSPTLDSSFNNSMDISPITSPELNINGYAEDNTADGGGVDGDDCVLKPIDMEIANSDSSNSPSPIFERQQNIQEHQNCSNFNNCNWIPRIRMDDNSMIIQNQQHHFICSPKAIKPVTIESNESYVPLIPSLQPLFEQQEQGNSNLSHLSPFQQQLHFQPNHKIEVDDNEKLFIRRSASSLSFKADSEESSRDAENKDEKIKNDDDNDDELSDEEEFALRALLIAKMNAVKKAQKQQSSSTYIADVENKNTLQYQNNEELIKNANNDSSQLVISHNVFEPPILNNNLNYENQILYNKNDNEVPKEIIKESLLENSSTSVGNIENLNNFISVKQQQQQQQQQIDKTEFVLKEAVKRLKNKKEETILVLKRTFDSDNDDIGNDEFKRKNQQNSCNKYFEYSNNSSSPIPKINNKEPEYFNDNIIQQQSDYKNNHEFNDNDIENMINIFENVQFDNIKLIHENITKYREYKKGQQQQQQQHVDNSVKLEKENQLFNKEQEITIRNKLIQSEDTKNLQENVDIVRNEQQIIHENYERKTKNSLEYHSEFPLSPSLSKTIDNNKINTEIPSRILNVEECNQSQSKGLKSNLTSDDNNQMEQKQLSKSVQKPLNSPSSGNVQKKQNQTSNIIQKSLISSSKSSHSSTTNKIQQQQKSTATSKVQHSLQMSEQSKQQTSKRPSTSSSTTFSKSLLSLSLASLPNLKITQTINDPRKIKKTRTKIINKPTNINSSTIAKNIQPLEKHKNLKTIINNTKLDDISSTTHPLKIITNFSNTKSFTSSANALKILQQQQQQQQQKTTTRLITKAEIPKIGKFIIHLGESSSSSSSSSESEQDNDVFNENYYNKNIHNNDDNASPMSLQMDSPVNSPAPSLINQEESIEDKSKNVDNELKYVRIGTGKTVVNDVFQAKLDEFLKSARTKVEKLKSNSITGTGDIPTQTTETKIKTNELRTPKEIQSKIIATKTPTAVRHLPQSSQLEYRKLISRMKILEKQKQARNSKINFTKENNTSRLDDLSLKTTSTTTILPSSSSSSFSSIQQTIINDFIEQTTSQNSKDKLIKKVLIKNASNLSHKKDSNDKFFSTNKENSPVIQLENENFQNHEKTQTNCDNSIISINQQKIIQQISTIVEKSSSKKSNQLEKLSIEKQNEKTEANRTAEGDESEKEHKIELLENYENDLKKNSTDLIENITKTIDLVLNAKNEKLQQLKLLQKYEKLKIEMKLIENNLNSQKKKLLKIYPVISDSHKKITNLRTNYKNLSKITINLGKQIHGDNYYGLSFEEKSLITNKSAQLSLEIKNLKSLSSSDLEENINLNWIICKKNNLNDKKQNNTGNLKNNNNEKNSFNFNNKNMKENESTNLNNEKLSMFTSDENNKDENNCKITNKQDLVEISNCRIQQSSEITDIIRSPTERESCNSDSTVSEKSKEIISNNEKCNLSSSTAFFSEINESNLDHNEIISNGLKSTNVMNEIFEKNVKIYVSDEKILESKQISVNATTDLDNDDKNNNDVENMEIPVIKVSEKEVVIKVSEKDEIIEESKKFSFNEFTTYVSPLSHNQSDNSEINDPNGIICPYQLMGQCDDKECKFLHLPNQ